MALVSRKKKKAQKLDQKPKKEFREEERRFLSSSSKGSWFGQESAFWKPASAETPVSVSTRKTESSKVSTKVVDVLFAIQEDDGELFSSYFESDWKKHFLKQNKHDLPSTKRQKVGQLSAGKHEPVTQVNINIAEVSRNCSDWR